MFRTISYACLGSLPQMCIFSNSTECPLITKYLLYKSDVRRMESFLKKSVPILKDFGHFGTFLALSREIQHLVLWTLGVSCNSLCVGFWRRKRKSVTLRTPANGFCVYKRGWVTLGQPGSLSEAWQGSEEKLLHVALSTNGASCRWECLRWRVKLCCCVLSEKF